MKRVVVTGMAGITSLGQTWDEIFTSIKAGKNGIKYMPEWEVFNDLLTRLAGPVTQFDIPSGFNRKATRGMGRVSLFATIAADNALKNANLVGHEVLKSGYTGVAFGSSAGNIDAIIDFGEMLLNHNARNINATTYIKMMPHTTAVSIAIHYGLQGLTLPTSSACTSGSMAIGQAYEAIKYGKQKVMLAGGAEELSASEAAVFDVMFATSCQNDTPEKTPKPFDQNRDGLVIGEGSGCLVLEEYEHALARNAKIYAEIIGYGSTTDGSHVTRPEITTVARSMELALEDAKLDASQVGYINAHGTATAFGDVVETQAIAKVFGEKPVSSLKSYFGHTLGACGAIEAWLSIEMLNNNVYAPTLNLEQVDRDCGKLDYIQHSIREMECDYILSNNSAFGGVNTSLVFKRVTNN